MFTEIHQCQACFQPVRKSIVLKGKRVCNPCKNNFYQSFVVAEDTVNDKRGLDPMTKIPYSVYFEVIAEYWAWVQVI